MMNNINHHNYYKYYLLLLRLKIENITYLYRNWSYYEYYTLELTDANHSYKDKFHLYNRLLPSWLCLLLYYSHIYRDKRCESGSNLLSRLSRFEILFHFELNCLVN